jgi:hypothetical protein
MGRQLRESHRASAKTIGEKPTNERRVLDDRGSGQSTRVPQIRCVRICAPLRRCVSTCGDLLGAIAPLSRRKSGMCLSAAASPRQGRARRARSRIYRERWSAEPSREDHSRYRAAAALCRVRPAACGGRGQEALHTACQFRRFHRRGSRQRHGCPGALGIRAGILLFGRFSVPSALSLRAAATDPSTKPLPHSMRWH